MAGVRAGSVILEANREYAQGRFQEALPLYEDALSMELDARTRFVVLRNLGRIFLTLARIDELVRAQRRADARRAWTEAIGIREGGVDRAAVACECGLLCLEDQLLKRAARCFKACIEYDTQHTHVAKLAHEKLGETSRLLGQAGRGPQARIAAA